MTAIVVKIGGSSRSQMFCKVGVCKNSKKITGKHLCWSLFLTKLHAETCNFIKKRVQYICFPVDFEKCLRPTFSQNSSGRLLMDQKPQKPAKSTKVSECFIYSTDSAGPLGTLNLWNLGKSLVAAATKLKYTGIFQIASLPEEKLTMSFSTVDIEEPLF